MEEMTIQSSNIKCAGCVSNIENGLNNFSGITEISIDVESNVVSLKGDGLNKAEIENKLNELGYPAV